MTACRGSGAIRADDKLQIAGLTTGYDQVVVRGDAGQGSFSAFCFKAGQLIGIESVNRAGITFSAAACSLRTVRSRRSRRWIPVSISRARWPRFQPVGAFTGGCDLDRDGIDGAAPMSLHADRCRDVGISAARREWSPVRQLCRNCADKTIARARSVDSFDASRLDMRVRMPIRAITPRRPVSRR